MKKVIKNLLNDILRGIAFLICLSLCLVPFAVSLTALPPLNGADTGMAIMTKVVVYEVGFAISAYFIAKFIDALLKK